MTHRRVFLSYSYAERDSRWLDSFADALNSLGLDVWRADRDIRVGEDAVTAIENVLLSSDAIVAVLYGRDVDSPNVFFELGAALGSGKRLILVVDSGASGAVPSSLRHLQTVSREGPEATARLVAKALTPSD